MKLDLLIQNGHVVFPGEGVKKANIGVRNGKIVGIYDSQEMHDAVKVLDAEGLHIFPGLVDAHEHIGIYNAVADDFADTMQNAIGGVTTVVNYYREPKGYHDVIPKLIEDGEANSFIDFSYSLGILTEQHIDELEEYVEKYKLTSFKFFRNYERQLNAKFKINNGIDLSAADLVRLLTKFKEISPKMLLAIHDENMDINRYLTKELMNQEVEDSLRTWSKTSPGYAEAESVLSTLYLNHIVGGNVFLVHLSAGASVDVLEKVPWLTQSGVKVETCPHYLMLTEDSATGLKAKVGPPIHSKQDQDRLWEGIANGTINAIGTDHCPSNRALKFAKGEGVWETLFGFPGVGGLLPLMITEGQKRGLTLERIADITSKQVADSFNLPEKGRIEVGADADFAIVDLKKEKTISHEMFYSACDYTVYEGMKAVGWPEYTISRGDIIVANGKPATDKKGRGKFIPRYI
jgi:dihydropyrimidinase